MGGVAGHLSHLYDNRNLTFNEMADILQKAAGGELVGTEKTDGYNIFLGYVDGKPRAARNKGDMSRGGMTFEDLINREFRGGESARKAYVTAFNAYVKAVESLSEKERSKIFGPNGEIFYNGKSIVKSLMKTPINGARLSSSYGKRKHPILGFTKMHTGTDFAAPTGTPIMASGDGVVTRAQWCGGGGNCVKIKHNSVYQTVYAHMSKFGRGIKKGVRVKQGQIIGYVGSTGLSTGPHLHYEVIENGKKINSQKLKLPSGKTLKGNQRKDFEVSKIKIDVLKSELIAGLN